MHLSSPFEFVHYADDTTIFKSDSDLTKLTLEINHGLVLVYQWICANELALNVSKTKFMIFSNRTIPNNVRIVVGDRTIDQTNEIKFLGITLDSKIKFTSHIKNVLGRVGKGIGTQTILFYT